MSIGPPHAGVRVPAAYGRHRLPHRRVAAAAALGLALLAAVLAGVWAGRHAAAAEPTQPAEDRQVRAGDARLTVPATWRPAPLSAAELPGLPPAKSTALSLRADVPAWMVATSAPADHASLVPLALRRVLSGPLPPPRETRLGGRDAWLYTGLTTRAGRALELTVQPTTAGVLAVACVSPLVARPAEALCGGAVTSATVHGATTLVPRQSVAVALGLTSRLDALDGARVRMRASLSRAESPMEQAGLARRLAGAHLGEASALAPLAGRAGAPLVEALREVGSAYEHLATAAAGGSPAAFSAARKDVDAAESRLAHAVGSVSRRIAPEPASLLRRSDAVAASGPSSSLLLLAVISLAASFAFVAGPRARSRYERTSGGSARPAPRQGWTCEITWHAGLRAAAFQATAARPGCANREIARSSPVQWPPMVLPERTPEIEEPLLALEERLLAAGWTPIGSSRPEWYRRRFAWNRTEPPLPLPATPAVESEWTCEIVWRAGLRGAGFHARATACGERKQLVVARSPKLEWPPLLAPSPSGELLAAVDGVERALIASGWKPAGRGTAWYARRFARAADAPPVAAGSDQPSRSQVDVTPS